MEIPNLYCGFVCLSCFLASRRTNNFWQAEYPSTYLGQFDTNYIIFRNVEIFKKYFFPNQKNIVKDNSGYLGLFHLLK